MTILLVEDDPGIGRAVSRGLAAEGYDVLWLKSAREALAAARARRFDAVVLDLGLPDGDGLDVCGALKAGGVATPVLMLTAREALADKLDGFRAGADDYIAKPFAFEELLARLGVLVRRGRELQVQYVAAGALRLDLRSRRAECAGEDLALSAREFDLLAGLARRPGEVLSRQALLDEVWGEEALHTENAVDVYVSYLRRRLADRPGAPRIETIRGRGYRLAAGAVA